jgi:hypothetical protein
LAAVNSLAAGILDSSQSVLPVSHPELPSGMFGGEIQCARLPEQHQWDGDGNERNHECGKPRPEAAHRE